MVSFGQGGGREGEGGEGKEAFGFGEGGGGGGSGGAVGGMGGLGAGITSVEKMAEVSSSQILASGEPMIPDPRVSAPEGDGLGGS